MDKIKTKVCLAGQEFPIVGNGSDEYVRQLEALVNSRIDDIRRKYPNMSLNRCTLLAMFNLADQCMELKKTYDQLDSRIAMLRDMPKVAPQGSKAASRSSEKEPVGV